MTLTRGRGAQAGDDGEAGWLSPREHDRSRLITLL